MSKPSTAPATLPAEAVAALEAARSALAERDRLLGLRSKLTADLAAARRNVVEAEKTAGMADTEVILAGDLPDPKLTRLAGAARDAAREAGHAVIRLDHALGSLPTRLAQADDAIEAALEPLRVQQEATFSEARDAYEKRLRGAVDQLAAVLQLGHALNFASGHQLRLHLNGISIPAPFFGDQPILTEGDRLRGKDGSYTDLSATWRTNPEAAALHALHAPLRPALDALRREMDRIRGARDEARFASRDQAMAARPNVTTGGPALPAPAPYEAPKGAGPGRSWTVSQPGGH